MKIETTVDNITEEEAKLAAESVEDIKGFAVYFAETILGFSALVYKNNHHIYHVNQYEIHFNWIENKNHDTLKARYMEILNHKLYTDEEIAAPLKNYDEYTAKERFLRSYHNMQVDNVSIFFLNDSKESENRWRKSIEGLHRNPISFCYMADEEFIAHEKELMDILNQRKTELTDDFEYQKNAFLSEMYNHEYGINWQADYDTLSAFGRLDFSTQENDIENYFNQLNFSKIQRKAYIAARNEYFEREVA